MIAVNKAHFPVTVLGHGKRIGIWLQGCGIRCKGCVSRDTWERTEGHFVSISSIVTWCCQIEHAGLDGITLSGGEPFEQAEALVTLLAELRRWTDTLPQAVDYVCYSGFPYKTLTKRHGGVLSLLDAVITEPYQSDLPTAPLRGSSNQRVVPLSELGKIRYADDLLALQGAENRIQFSVGQDQIWFIGIPARGDMARLEEQCRQQGLELRANSWRP